MIKFTQAVSMPCTPEQFERDLRVPLTKMGYEINEFKCFRDSSFQTICNNYSGELWNVDNIFKGNNLDKGRYFIEHYNPDLFLSLAVMNDSELGLPGEWYKFIAPETFSEGFVIGKIYQLRSSLNQRGCFLDGNGDRNGFYPGNQKVFRKATKEEIVEHFLITKRERLKGKLSSLLDGMSYNELIFVARQINGFDQEEVEDNNAFVKDFTDNCQITDDISLKLFGSESIMQIGGEVAADDLGRKDLIGRSLYFPDTVELTLHELDRGTLVEIRKP